MLALARSPVVQLLVLVSRSPPVRLLSRVRVARPLLPVVLLVAVTSFALCVWLTAVAQPWAFFSLPTRAWELATGGAVAVLAPQLRRPRVVA